MPNNQITDVRMAKEARRALANGNQHEALRLLDRYIATQPTLNDHDILSRAVDIRKAKYLRILNRAVKRIVDDWKEGSFLRGELENTCSVEYLDDAVAILLNSDNEAAGHAELGAEAFDWDGGIPWTQLATYALRADVLETVRTEHNFDVYDEPPREPVRFCKSCDQWRPLGVFKHPYEDDDNCRDCREGET